MPDLNSAHTPRTRSARAGREAQASRRWPAIISVALLIAATVAAGASAQLNVSDTADTKYTPAAKETTAWAQVGGAEFGVDKYPPASPTPVEVEFYTVAFENDTHGFAGGMQCRVPPTPGTSGQALTDYLVDCGGSGRQPVIYEYVQTETEESWHPVLPPEGEGYVGAIAFMPDGRALAVGGTGEYPKREPGPAEGDVAGEGRTWIYERGLWTEIKDGRTPDGMRGMTALAMSPRVGDCVDDREECGLAGAYQQAWLWKDGRFVKGFFGPDGQPEGAQSGTVDVPAGFRFRIRQIGFVPAFPTQKLTKAVAVTSGCCDPVAAENSPRVLVFDGDALYVKDVVASQRGPDSLYGLVLEDHDAMSLIASPGGEPASDAATGDLASRIYGSTTRPHPADSNVLPPGATPTQTISTVRLTAGAGTTRGASSTLDWAVGSLTDSGQGLAYSPDRDNAGNTLGTDAVPDPPQILRCPGGDWPWSAPLVPRITKPNSDEPDPPDLTCQRYEPQEIQEQTGSKAFFELPSYALNALAFTDETQSVGWAVGDRGALVRLGGVGTTAASAPTAPAKVGAATTARFGGSDVYDQFRPLPTDGDTAPVPSLASNGTTDESPRLIPGGSPNPSIPLDSNYAPEDVSSIAMSRDGSEGWAVGTGYPGFTGSQLPQAEPVPTVYHYDGSRWSRCDIRGVAGLLPADPACAGLARLFGHGTATANVILTHAVRVPLENDDDPSNDDEFEVVATGGDYEPGGDLPKSPVVARYRNGQWSVDEVAQRQLGAAGLHTVLSVAFTAPDDGWLTASMRTSATLWHWDGSKWWDCATVQARADACGDGDELLPVTGGGESDSTLAVAGRRLYFASNRIPGNAANSGAAATLTGKQPAILYKDPGGVWTAEDGGYDPGCVPQEGGGCAPAEGEPDASALGRISSFTVASGPRGYEGWAIGRFGTTPVEQNVETTAGDAPTAVDQDVVKSSYYLLRLRDGKWTPHLEDDASRDYLPSSLAGRPGTAMPVVLDPAAGTAAIYRQDYTVPRGPGVLLFDPARGENGRWRVLETPFSMRTGSPNDAIGYVHALAPDGAGGAWIASKQRHSSSAERESVHLWRYTGEVPKPVFEEAPNPVRESITGGAAGRDGSFWVTTNSGFVYRYDRLTGWDKLRVPGWDPGRVVTRTSEANAVAVGADGEGLVVGKNGRIAHVSPIGVQLDAAAGKACGSPPCGTGRDLRSVAVAADGSALAGGDGSVLLYRPPGEEFRRIDFGGSENASITGISMPSSDRAWLTNTFGQVFVGRRDGDAWQFFVENRAPGGKLLSLDELGKPLALRDVQIDASGQGYAVGKRGLILERRGDEGGWQRIKTGFMDDFRSIALSPQGRDGGALIGGDMGLILTLEDGDFRVSREADLYDPLNFGNGSSLAASVLGVAIVPGVEPGQTEAWAVQQVPSTARQNRSGPGAILHYSSDPDHPLLRPGGRVDPLPDAPDPRPGEISFAAFGRSDCHGSGGQCAEGHVANLFNEVVSRRVTRAVLERSERPGGPQFAVFTGDVGRAAGKEQGGQQANRPLDKSWVHRRWTERVADPFADARFPLFGAVGLNDLDRTAVCTGASACPVDSKAHAAGTGLASGWRRAMAGMTSPWGAPASEQPAPAGDTKFVEVKDPTTLREEPAEARTHYAMDLETGGRKVARVIFLDNSMRTLASSEPNQNPVEQGGQEEWLKRMLSGVDKAGGQQAIVVMNTPTYSYTAGDPTTWAGDAAVLERTLMEHGVKMVVSGRLGWNGRSWATSPAVHHPCPGGPYIHDDDAPEPETQPCGEQTGGADPAGEVGTRLADALGDLGAPAPPGEGDLPPLPGEDAAAGAGLQGLLPMVVASSAGGTFGPAGTDGGPASDGWWHGYTIVRMDAGGDPRKTIVEQRPVFDWITISAPTHLLKPRQRMTLRGEGREPVGMDVPARFDLINSPAITHRYDLVLADESNPSIPRRDDQGGYIEVPQSVGFIDEQSGLVRAGAGRQERTYTIAILSVGDKTATWPIAFEPAKSFKPREAAAASRSVINTPPQPAPVRPLAPPPVVLNSPPSPTPPPPPPANIPQVTLPTLQLPAPPAFPNIPSLPAGTPTPAPPPPAAPPAPPGSSGALPLSLQAPLAPISVVTTVIPPSPPPVNPAPPGGSAARKEARQRQAATAKSEEGGGDQGAGETQSGGESGSSEMTRRDRTRPAPSYGDGTRGDRRYSFTAVSQGEQASAWSRGALYGGMVVATSLVLALGWGIARPTPRRRHPPRPAPETVRTARRRPWE